MQSVSSIGWESQQLFSILWLFFWNKWIKKKNRERIYFWASESPLHIHYLIIDRALLRFLGKNKCLVRIKSMAQNGGGYWNWFISVYCIRRRIWSFNEIKSPCKTQDEVVEKQRNQIHAIIRSLWYGVKKWRQLTWNQR